MIDSGILLSVTNLKVEIDGHTILKNISFDVKRDSTLAIIGPNGAGKSMLFKAILGLISYQGKVEWKASLKIGYVPQKILVNKDFPLTVYEFLQFKEHHREKIIQSLKDVGLWREGKDIAHRGHHLLNTKLGALSGGELQRVLISYAILGDPRVFLFDEPTSGVDIAGEETVYALINRLQKEKDLTIMFISHELDIVNKYADSVLCLNKEKICLGPPKVVIDSHNLEALYGEDFHLYTHGH